MERKPNDQSSHRALISSPNKLFPGSMIEEDKYSPFKIHEDDDDFESSFDSLSDAITKMVIECPLCMVEITEDNNLMCIKCQNIFHRQCLIDIRERDMPWPFWKVELNDQNLSKNREYSRTLDMIKTVQMIEEHKNDVSFCQKHNKHSDMLCQDCNEIIWEEWLALNQHQEWSTASLLSEYDSYKAKYEALVNRIIRLRDSIQYSISGYQQHWIENRDFTLQQIDQLTDWNINDNPIDLVNDELREAILDTKDKFIQHLKDSEALYHEIIRGLSTLKLLIFQAERNTKLKPNLKSLNTLKQNCLNYAKTLENCKILDNCDENQDQSKMKKLRYRNKVKSLEDKARFFYRFNERNGLWGALGDMIYKTADKIICGLRKGKDY